MLPTFCTQEIIRIRPSTTTSRGSTIPDWSPDKITTKTIGGCSVQPSTTTLSQDGRVLGISEQWTAYLPEGSDVQAGDRIQFGGKIYTINGEPRVWTGAFSRSHIQLTLTLWEG